MNDKKNIERFFQEKFKDFEVNPEPQAWANISERINKKKNKKRIFPFWLISFGIAASLIIGYFVFNEFSGVNSNKLIENNSTIVHSESTKTQDENSKLNKINFENETTVVSTNVKKASENPDKSSDSESSLNLKNDALANANNSKNEIKNSSDKNKINTNSPKLKTNNSEKEGLASSSVKKIKNNQNLIQNNVPENAIVSNKKEKTNQQLIQNNISENENEIISNKKGNSNSNEKEIIASNFEKNKFENNNQLNNKNLIAATKTEDLTKKEALIENPLDKIAKEKESKTSKKAIASNSEKWTIRPNVAPIFMKASNGSPIHDIFADNEKNYVNNVSVGIGADYAVTKKFSIRAGINKFDLAYNTNEIAYYSDLTAVNGLSASNSIQTINLNDEFHNIVIGDKKSRGVAVVTPPNQTAEETGYLNQKFGYLEFPVEVSYKLLDKKFGITLISGLSTLLLNNNEVSIVSNNKTLDLGDVNNLSKVHYSTNIGIGLKYSFWKSFEANVEPTLKYQINSFTSNSGGFNPYFLGIYSGVSYKL
jgi:hypothetical protein